VCKLLEGNYTFVSTDIFMKVTTIKIYNEESDTLEFCLGWNDMTQNWKKIHSFFCIETRSKKSLSNGPNILHIIYNMKNIEKMCLPMKRCSIMPLSGNIHKGCIPALLERILHGYAYLLVKARTCHFPFSILIPPKYFFKRPFAFTFSLRRRGDYIMSMSGR